MCGIFGCIGKGDLINETLRGLKILEYRGYDSAGLVYHHGKKLVVKKAVGTIDKLNATIPQPTPTTQVCLGHTRWATNGKVCLANSHPHLSFNNQITVVHNGIIENEKACRALLAQHDIQPRTTVDTELIPNILYLLHHNKHNIHQYLTGQYVFAAYDLAHPQQLFLAKKGNLPLYLGQAPDCLYLASDTLAFPATVTSLLSLADGDTAIVRANQVSCYHGGRLVQRNWQPFQQTYTAVTPGDYPTFMEKEIHEIPDVLTRINHTYQQDPAIQKNIKHFQNLLRATPCIHLCGCGTSYHAAQIIANLIEKYYHCRAIAHISSEFSPDTILDNREIALVISQSGETADTLQCLQKLRERQLTVACFCNVLTSSIARQCTLTFPLLCGPEIAVASTKVFCASLLVGAHLLGVFPATDLASLPDLAVQMLKLANILLPPPSEQIKKTFFIGKGLDYFLANEAALKVKEITYTHCESYPANELKHGPLSLVDATTLAVVYQGETANAVAEIMARGGQVIELADPAPQNALAFIVKIIPAQMFALKLAEQRKIDPDKPRNLAKSVTVL